MGFIVMVIFFGIIFSILIEEFSTWDLSSVGLSPDTEIISAAVWRNRAFLALANSNVSLVEAPWPELSIFAPLSQVKVFPKDIKGPKEAVALEIDSKGRLWVSDRKAKHLLAYDLKRNQKLFFKELPFGCTGMAVDTSLSTWNPKVYLGSAEYPNIIWVYSYQEDRIWPMRLESDDHRPVMPLTLLLSRRETLLFAFNPKSELVYGINTTEISNGPIPAKDFQMISRPLLVRWLGHKLGPNRGALLDNNQGMHYFLPRDGACVRWDTRRRLLAESHQVILQRGDLQRQLIHGVVDIADAAEDDEMWLCVTAYLQDSRSVWGVARHYNGSNHLINPHCIRLEINNLY